MIHALTHGALFIQLIGFVALGVSLVVFQVAKRSNMLKLQMSASALYTIHFFLLGAYTGAALNATNVLRNYIFYKTKHRTWLLPGVFIVIFCVVGVLTWQGPLSLLPLGGMVSGTLAFWQRNPKYIRLLALVSPPLWFTYNALSGSYPGMISEVITLSSTLVGIYRFDIRGGVTQEKALSKN